MARWHQSNRHDGWETVGVREGSLSFRWWMIAVSMMLLVAPLSGCSGKKRNFTSGPVSEETTSDTQPDGTGSASPGEPLARDDVGGGSGESQERQASNTVPGTFVGPTDAGSEQAALPTSMTTCGDACSGECAPGTTLCSSSRERIECGIDALWAQPVACENLCLVGACAGECPPGASECVSTTRFRSCSELGTWSEPTDCENACVGIACGGECLPGETRCASTTSVQTCDDQGQWGQTTGCQNACAGSACTGECMPGAARCSSETQLQRCNDQGQFSTPTACQFACVNGGCGGECSPGSGRCNPANGVPQFCSSTGIWQSQARCQFVCSGSGTCGGECTPGSRRCNPASGAPQLCSGSGSWQNQTPCQFVCTGSGICSGECAPGSRRCNPASGVPQLCSNGATWQNQAVCARGCQNGACIPQQGLGSTCGSATDCTSGFCVDGVCCESTCQGVCTQCQAGTGRCIAPADDAACGRIPCSTDAVCQVTADLTSNRCLGVGQCKTSANCSTSNAPQRTVCSESASFCECDENCLGCEGFVKVCNGSGSCVEHTVTCGGAQQPIGPDNLGCCLFRFGSAAGGGADPIESQTFETDARECSPGGFFSFSQSPMTCDSQSDCDLNRTCCLVDNGNFNAIACELSCVETGSNAPSPATAPGVYRVCSAPGAGSTPCPNGRACNRTHPSLPGWRFCTVP